RRQQALKKQWMKRTIPNRGSAINLNTMNSQPITHNSRQTAADSLLRLSWGIIKVGALAFGGHAALVVMVEQYLVSQKKLLRREEVLNGMSLATLLPGPLAV